MVASRRRNPRNSTAKGDPQWNRISRRKRADRIRYALANPLCDDQSIDPMRELAALLREVGLETESGGGTLPFAGRDPIVSSPLPFATMAAVALMAKAVSVAAPRRPG